MSKLFTRLHRIITTTPKPTNPLPFKPTTDQIYGTHRKNANSKLNRFVTNLLNEKDSNKLVQHFTMLSEISNFRCRRKLYDITINRLKLANEFELIEKALEPQKKYISGEGFGARIIVLYGKCGMFDHAHKVFDEMPERNCVRGVKSFNALLGAAVNSHKFDEAVEIFRGVPANLLIKPDADSYSAAANAYCCLGLFDEAVSLLDEMEGDGLKPTPVFYNTVIGALYGKGKYDEAEKIWERMSKSGVEPDSCTYGYMMQRLVNGGELNEANELLVEWKSKGLRPNVGVYNALIEGYCKNDDLYGAREWYDEMIKHGCVPNKTTFDVLVPYLCEKGNYGFAFKVCEKKLERICSVDEASLQEVVDGLVKNSMIKEAETLVNLGRNNSYVRYNLVMPSAN